MGNLDQDGWSLFPTQLSATQLDELRDTAFTAGAAGTRCLLDLPGVRDIAHALRVELVAAGHLLPGAVAIQAIAFDKTPGSNWKVTWHQDVMFPFARRVTASGFDLPSVKDGVDYARPPHAVLATLLAVRLHIDECDEHNGPLRVAPRTHLAGILRSTEIAGCLAQHGEHTCLARRGEALLMKPLLLHASSPATSPAHRRVLHLVFHNGSMSAEPWHRSV